MKKKLFKKVLTLAVAGAMVLGMTVPTLAATTITESTGTLNIVKYDMTAAEKTDADLIKGTGEALTTEELSNLGLSGHEMQGITFAYIKVGDVAQYEFLTGEEGSQEEEEELVYSISSALEAILKQYGDLNGGQYGTDDDIQYVIIDGDTSTHYYTSDDLVTAMAAAVATYDGQNALYNMAKDVDTTVTTGSNGTATVNDLAVGLYLVVEVQVSPEVTTTTDPFLVSIPMTNSSGTGWNYNVWVYPKNKTDTELVPDKEVAVEDGDSADTVSALTSNTLTYTVLAELGTITTEATYYDELIFTDTLSAGMDYSTVTGGTYDVKVQIYAPDSDGSFSSTVIPTYTWSSYGTSDSDYFNFTVTTTASGNKTATLTFNAAGLKAINAPTYSGYYILVTYTVYVSDPTALTYGDTGNNNKVTVTFSRTSSEKDSHEDEAKVYYYGIDLTKLFDGGSTGTFSSVQFTLQDADGNYIVSDTSTTIGEKDTIPGKYYVTGTSTTDDTENNTTRFTPDSDSGHIYIYGLSAGTYTLTEVQTATGYNLLEDPITIIITETSGAEYTPGTYTWNYSTETGSWVYGSWSDPEDEATATVDEKTTGMEASGNSGDALVMIEINNTKGFTLPLTGGMGTMLIVIIGAVIICLAVVVGNRSKKRKAA